MLTFRIAPVRFTTFALLTCFFALGCFDTVQAQNLTVSSSTLVFTAPQGGNPSPATQQVSVGVTGGSAITYTISTNLATGSNWLFASTGQFSSNSGTAPDTLTVEISSSSLGGGNYNGTITLTPPSGSPVTITVTLAVTGGGGSGSSVLSASPSQLSFGFELGHSGPASQTTQILSSGISLPFSFSTNVASTSNCTQNWLQPTVSTNTTPATLTISINTAGLAAGTCTGNVTLTSNTSGNGTTTTIVGIVLFISSSALLNVNVPTALSAVTLQQGGRPVQFNISLTSSDSTAIPYTVSATSTGIQWLAVSPSGGTSLAQPNIDVQITPGTVLSPGSYTGAVTINSPGLFNNVLTIPVSLTITSMSSVTVTPGGTQSFTELQGGAVPAPLTLTLTGSTNSTFSTSIIQGPGGSWLQVSPPNGSLTASSPGTIVLSVAQNALLQGVYSSQVLVSFQNSSIPSITIFVSLTVAPPASAIVATPAGVVFSYQTGGIAPAVQTVTITNPATGSLPFTVASVSDSWIAVSPSSGTTPENISVSVSPQSLQAGSYSGSFTLTSPGLASTTISVSLFVSATTTPQPFIISNSASGVGGQLAPGEIITIKGSGLGPGTPVSFTVNSLSSPTLAGVEVTFDGVAGTLLYVSSTQINVTVPYEIAGRASTMIVVSYQNVPSSGIPQPVAAASLGLFTNNATGSGQAAIVNQNFTYNTTLTPALQGSYISVYATGGGQTNPSSFDGEVSPTTSLLPLILQSNVTATIGGKPAVVQFAGAAPGYVTGLVQFNIQVPTGVTGGALPIVVTIGGATTVQSQTTATVAVQ